MLRNDEKRDQMRISHFFGWKSVFLLVHLISHQNGEIWWEKKRYQMRISHLFGPFDFSPNLSPSSPAPLQSLKMNWREQFLKFRPGKTFPIPLQWPGPSIFSNSLRASSMPNIKLIDYHWIQFRKHLHWINSWNGFCSNVAILFLAR